MLGGPTDWSVGRIARTVERAPDEPPRPRRTEPQPPRADPRRRVPRVRDARLPRHRRGRHRGRRGDVEGRHLLPLPDEGSDLPRAHGDDRGQARRAGGEGGGARDGAGRACRGGDPHGPDDVRRPPDDGPAAVPRHRRGGPRVPGRDERAPRAVRRRSSRATSTTPSPPGRSRRSTPRITSIAWFGAINEVVARWLLADDAARLEDAYPALRATLLRSAGVPEARIGEVPLPGAGLVVPRGREAPAGCRPVTATRDPRADTGAGLGERVAGLLATSPGDARRTLVAATLPAPAADPVSLYAAAVEADLEAALWLRPSEGTAFVGIGRAWATEAAGDGPLPRGGGRLAGAHRRCTARPARGRRARLGSRCSSARWASPAASRPRTTPGRRSAPARSCSRRWCSP